MATAVGGTHPTGMHSCFNRHDFIDLIAEKPESVEPEEGQVLCEVCSDIANGVHFGVPTCEGCKVKFHLFVTWERVT